jgi:hypothetical protein
MPKKKVDDGSSPPLELGAKSVDDSLAKDTTGGISVEAPPGAPPVDSETKKFFDNLNAAFNARDAAINRLVKEVEGLKSMIGGQGTPQIPASSQPGGQMQEAYGMPGAPPGWGQQFPPGQQPAGQPRMGMGQLEGLLNTILNSQAGAGIANAIVSKIMGVNSGNEAVMRLANISMLEDITLAREIRRGVRQRLLTDILKTGGDAKQLQPMNQLQVDPDVASEMKKMGLDIGDLGGKPSAGTTETTQSGHQPSPE